MGKNEKRFQHEIRSCFNQIESEVESEVVVVGNFVHWKRYEVVSRKNNVIIIMEWA